MSLPVSEKKVIVHIPNKSGISNNFIARDDPIQ